MIRRLLYVACDDCGVPAGTADHMTETTRGARLMASSFGFKRVRVEGKFQDRCPKCGDQQHQDTDDGDAR